MIAITNASLFKNSQLYTGQVILIAGEKIKAIGTNLDLHGFEIIDAAGGYVVPGFVDLQIYGSGGDLFSAYPSEATLKQMDADLITKGTTGFLACVATNSPEVVYQAISAAKAYREKAKGFLGLHLEGPYLNSKRLGAHVPEYVCKAKLEEVKRVMEHADGTVKMMTIAAELQDDEVITYLLKQGVVLSLGHSDASFEQAMSAYEQGFKTTTHLFNAMPSIHHRAPNLPTAVLNHPSAMASIIADGEHVNFEIVKMSYQLMGERLFLITDAVTPCQIGPYQHQLEGDRFVTPNGTLSGSNITMLHAIHNCVRYCGVPLDAALRMASLNPLKLMGMDNKKGLLTVGNTADLLILSEELKLQKVFAGGVEY